MHNLSQKKIKIKIIILKGFTTIYWRHFDTVDIYTNQTWESQPKLNNDSKKTETKENFRYGDVCDQDLRLIPVIIELTKNSDYQAAQSISSFEDDESIKSTGSIIMKTQCKISTKQSYKLA